MFKNAASYVCSEKSCGQNLGGNGIFSLAAQSKLVMSIHKNGITMINELTDKSTKTPPCVTALLRAMDSLSPQSTLAFLFVFNISPVRTRITRNKM